ncbi:cut9 interacting protein Scn1 [Lineolata rhizophorae]|uniref:Cut9 interacting protein Scn1 n=1 Tax=Lineolata rhizophorae TaxID=578093 RepID=A0A6A6NWZ2_9PEZI|nr:cut9 interacting protein Scn1 [Lineolata rhizophorae]
MSNRQPKEEFPWDLGVFDAHCHPTDTLSSIPGIRGMRAKCLTIMATRAEDQPLVAKAADELGIAADLATSSWPESLGQVRPGVVPSFGWHPWFSHQVFVDDGRGDGRSALQEDAKVDHYRSVLTAQGNETLDRDFCLKLPDPRPLSEFIAETRDYLKRYPHALVGEVGLDKSFRLPEAWLPHEHASRDETLTPGGREGRKLSPHKVQVEHQKRVLKAQLQLAGEMQRAVSVHGVQAHGIVFETLQETWRGHERRVQSRRERKRRGSAPNAHSGEEPATNASKAKEALPKPYPPRVCLHSYSGPPEAVKQYTNPAVPAEIYFSFSAVINFSSSGASKTEQAIKVVPDNMILVESDLHTAGLQMDEKLEEMARKICDLRGWNLRDGIIQLRENWKRFVFGS